METYSYDFFGQWFCSFLKGGGGGALFYSQVLIVKPNVPPHTHTHIHTYKAWTHVCKRCFRQPGKLSHFSNKSLRWTTCPPPPHITHARTLTHTHTFQCIMKFLGFSGGKTPPCPALRLLLFKFVAFGSARRFGREAESASGRLLLAFSAAERWSAAWAKSPRRCVPRTFCVIARTRSRACFKL